jgi:nucleotide-binding universal stress UspA family protein
VGRSGRVPHSSVAFLQFAIAMIVVENGRCRLVNTARLWQAAVVDLDALKLILVPTDFSEVSATALQVAVKLAQTFHAAIEVFHVDIDPTLVLPPPLGAVSRPVLFERVLASTFDRLDRLVAEVRKSGVTCSSAEDLGRSHTAIVERARLAGAGLIVMGSHGKRGLRHVLLGSAAEKVVEHAPCAVLVVPVSSP